MAPQHEKEILITGFGGQGIVLAGNILGKAAAIHDGKHATLTQSYGPEARGGSCSAQVMISDEEILFPYVEQPQVLVCMSQESYTKNIGLLGPGGLLIWDTDLVQTGEHDPNWVTYSIPATRFAEELGSEMMANIVMLGFLSAVSDLVSVEALRQAVLSSVPPQTKDKNAKAFERGREYGEAILKSVAMQDESRNRDDKT
ncbi:MAG: pyruvate ferredoxin oxidoreductase [Candidatus Abyssobacteria bacterium SURF_17]|jgi:2-oxoglutarate ferredoxin oxidoreductase subunit gamma|uniref:Pyruvate ferredoxin oxidoreductase n=1 Tax=Candidatus Abyssobacteria bacterium SURF_17 TaxID=2093361 RepID=A0A419EZS1_9BACT|nr:MAG: pyruvate ferredoxin oxidoreductase [Candidatus Abyssubacteria bacterium SURF_17]